MEREQLQVTTCRNVSTSSRKVLEYIEETFDSIIKEIQIRPHGNPSIVLDRVTALTPVSGDASTSATWHVASRRIKYCWPGKNKDEAWRFACVGRILSEIHHAILVGTSVTKRDIYYREPELFKRQETVDCYIDDIAHTCGVTRKDLYVTASPKGLVAGLMSPHEGPIIISDQYPELDSLDLRHVNWILVIEKEASFKQLVDTRFQQVCATIGPGILLTGRGYPDLATRGFLRTLTDSCSHHVPLFGLFDADPDGIEIFKCYSMGSKGLAQETAFNVPEMRLLELSCAGILSSSLTNTSLPLTGRDRKKARSMLSRPEWDEMFDAGGDMNKCRVSLQQMLFLNRKAELQVLEEIEGGMLCWLEKTMSKACR